MAAAVGLGLTVGSAMTLGSVKVFIFALTLGNIQPTFPSGFLYFGEFTLKSNAECVAATWDLVEDSCYLGYKGFQAVKWTFDYLNLTQLFVRIMDQVWHLLSVTFERVVESTTTALNDELGVDYKGYPLLSQLDDLTEAYRIDFNKKSRSWGEIGTHALLSLPSIPLHLTASLCSSVAAAILAGAFVGKVLIHATTGLHIPVPTGAPYTIRAACDTGLIAVKDLSTDFADIFVVVYKTADLLHITTLAAKALDVILYIPKAIFS
jgi:hypothetical protein